ncbi:MAG: ABC transporter permease [candidate division NC10 bacterium]|nr:ABC transporter permease [candidate division NC10 bacterium]
MRTFCHLIRLVAWRTLLRDRMRSLITILGVALGVAVVLAIRLANDGVLESFRNSLDHVAGKSRLQVSAGEVGFDWSWAWMSWPTRASASTGGPRRNLPIPCNC